MATKSYYSDMGEEEGAQPHSLHVHDSELSHLHHDVSEGFGEKGIGSWAGGILLWNNITGPALVQIPLIFLNGGLIAPLIVFILVTVLSAFSGTLLASAMKRIPGNDRFQSRIEFSTLSRYYLGTKMYWVMQLMFNLSLLSLNLVSILLTIAVMDWTLIAIFGRTCALRLYPHFGGICVEQALGTRTIQDSPFGNAMVISLGFLVVLIMIIPMGYFSLDDNIWVQVVAFFLSLCIMIDFVVVFFRVGFDFSAIPLLPPETCMGSLGSVLGPVILNYAFITTIPSWVNEKKPHVSVNSTTWVAVSTSTFTYLLIGLLGAWSFPNAGASGGNILAAIRASDKSTAFDAVAVYLFPLLVVATSIPIYGIIIRYNLVENEICSKNWANIWAQVLPWIIAIPLTAGNVVFNDVVNWTSLVFQSFINLIVPFILYFYSLRHVHLEDTSTTEEESETTPLLIQEQQGGNSAAPPLWSAKYPRAARCCPHKFGIWMDTPKKAKPPALPFSQRLPRAASCLPARFVRWLDTPFPAAPEHHGLPRGLEKRCKMSVALFFAITATVLVIAGIILSLVQSVVPNPHCNITNATNVTSSIADLFEAF